MRYYLYHISLLLVACLSMVSCSENDVELMDDTQFLELTVNCNNLAKTRATMPGEADRNENLIHTLHYFVYVSGKTGENAVLSDKIDIAANTQTQAIVRIPMNETELNTVVFPRPINDCYVYLIANLPDDVTIPQNTSLANLKTLAVTANFKDNTVQESFVMDGEATATITSRNKTVAATGEIALNRLAAKFTTRVSVANSFLDTDGKEWTPLVNQMKIHLDNTVSNTTLGAAFGTNHFDYGQRTYIGTKTETVDGKSKKLYVFEPFYSYPCQWEYSNEDALAMYIVLPWQCSDANGSTRYQDCFYKVYPGIMQLNRNTWYNIDIHIGVLGSFTEKEEPVVIDDFKYKVIDWKNGYSDWSAGLDIDTELLSAHYLVVERNSYEVNNKNTFEIPFITSHKCVIKDLKVTRMVFGDDSNPKPDSLDITDEAKSKGWLTLDGNTIKLNHTLNNDFINTTNYDFSPYTFTFTLCHENNAENFYEEITITQKPAISITAHLNSYREAYLDGKLPQGNDGTNGYQYVNGTAANTNGTGDYGGAYGLYIRSSSTTNTNPYMYTIEVTVLPEGSEYILGDPRWETPATSSNKKNLDFDNFKDAPGIESEGQAERPNRKLKNYYGTKTDASVQNMIAPKFRIASSHGVTQTVTHTNAINRAATYQEDGYPAGRWRVPTMAEVKFIIKLSRDGKIPRLFNNGSAYWCSNGTVTPNTSGGISTETGTSGNNAVRCVYDDWYWEHSTWPRMASRGDHPGKYNQFTWGDEVN